METPKEILSVVQEVVKSETDPTVAISKAIERVYRLPEFATFRDGLIRQAIQDLVYDARHQHNTRVKRDNGYFDSVKPIVKPGESAEVHKTYASVYSFHMGEKTLGDVVYEDLETLQTTNENTAKGFTFRARLCEWLRDKSKSGMREEKTVKECVKLPRLKAAFQRIYREVYAVAAPAAMVS